MNIKLNYLYRDYSNYKNFGSIVFANPDQLDANNIREAIIENLIDGEFFDAAKLGLPNLFFEDHTQDDHQWHEFESIETTTEPADSNTKINDLLDCLR